MMHGVPVALQCDVSPMGQMHTCRTLQGKNRHTGDAAEAGTIPAGRQSKDAKATKSMDDKMGGTTSGEDAENGQAEEAPAVAASGSKRKRDSAVTLALQGTEPIGLVPEQVHSVISMLFAVDGSLLSLVFQAQGAIEGKHSGSASADMFFIRTVAVPPTKFRPISEMQGSTFEHPQNVILCKVCGPCSGRDGSWRSPLHLH